MNDIMLFGNKGEFAIQLGLHPNKKKCKLCFWAKGKKIGTFTRGAELDDSIKVYYQFSGNREDYYLPILDGMNPSQIIEYLVLEALVLVSSSKDEDFEEYQRRAKLHLNFGSQFTNDSSDLILLNKDDNVIIIYNPEKEEHIYEFVISFNTFSQVYEEYITYCLTNGLV
ncbi:Imm42 family immunity protein [Chitinophaga niabensis]|uniref:Immunity protein 42 n=1 Tax=Chitinophaga niabensis TaxID=536979 RepID=A0A1N6DF24_9BACT|nr:Imm42 family immunity protein [Chitinophaga niabensis]SIN69234.1 Immunity protein 42 [Chitinophaga niabensis]